MADTFGQAWRAVRNHCPLAPASLAQYWVQNAYTNLNRERRWSYMRAESEILTDDYSTGTVNVTRKSATVQGNTLTFVSTDAGRQFRVSVNQPVYTIISVDTRVATLATRAQSADHFAQDFAAAAYAAGVGQLGGSLHTATGLMAQRTWDHAFVHTLGGLLAQHGGICPTHYRAPCAGWPVAGHAAADYRRPGGHGP